MGRQLMPLLQLRIWYVERDPSALFTAAFTGPLFHFHSFILNSLQKKLTGNFFYLQGATNGTEKPAEMEKADEADKPKMEVKELTEEEKFAPGRTGWAPQFSAPAAEDGTGEEPGLPPTLLEGKLEDKFFGGMHPGGVVYYLSRGLGN